MVRFGAGGMIAALILSTALTAPAVAAPGPHQGPGEDPPAAPPAGQPRGRDAWIRKTIASMSLEQKVGQLFVPYVTGGRDDEERAENTARFGVATPAEAVRKFHLGGVIYFAWSDNTKDPAQIARLSNGLQRAAVGTRVDAGEVPLSIATDQETGLVARVGPPATVFPGAMALGAGRDRQATHDTYAITGEELRALGINVDYAPDADVNVNPANPVIGVRSFSSDPELVAHHVRAAVRGLQGEQVTATAKHFPGHGDTGTDSHYGLPVINHTRRQWEEIDAPPFRAAIESGVDAIMTAHISFPAFDDSGDPSTLSHPVLTGLLREELGFDGVIATDSLRMQGVRDKYGDDRIPVLALEAGADVLLDPQQPDQQIQAVIDAVRSGELTERRIEQSVTRILTQKWRRGVIENPYVDESRVARLVGTRAHLARAQQITDGTTTLVTDRAGLVPLPRGRVLVTGFGAAAVPQLAQELTRRGHPATGLYPTTLDQPAIDRAVAAAQQHDLVVVTTSAAAKSAIQQQQVAALRATGKPIVVVALRDAYDIAYLSGIESYLATYSATAPAITSVAKVLAGDLRPRGKLPVDIPRADDPSRILFPFGIGLRS